MLFKHRAHIGVLAVKGLEHRAVVLRVTLAQDHVAKALAVFACQAAMIDEPVIRVVFQHLRPQIGVIAGGIAIRPDVQEIAGAIARRHIGNIQAAFGQRRRFECIDILLAGRSRQRMPFHIQHGRRDRFAQGIALVELRRLLDLVDQRLRDGRAGAIIFGVMGHDFGIERPMFVELRRELHPVARGIGARYRGIDLRGEQAVQRMAEFVEHGGHIVRTDQRRLTRCGLKEIGHIVDDGLGAQQGRLVDEV